LHAANLIIGNREIALPARIASGEALDDREDVTIGLQRAAKIATALLDVAKGTGRCIVVNS
jgi:hypothetical protein